MSPLKRERRPMPDFVREAMESRGLMSSYLGRPAYQRNDYMRWITDASRPETRPKRLNQMLDELEQGSVYMKMRWHPRSQRPAKPK